MNAELSLAWTLNDVAEFSGGTVFGDPATPITSVVTDSREAQPGALFVAMEGEETDGHLFVDTAMEKASAAMVIEGRLAVQPRVEVADPREGLHSLAIRRRSELGAAVVAVTGSTGKTSTKDLLRSVLGDRTWASPKSFNNEVGVPLTLLGAPADTRYLVAEVGARGVGHIAHLMPIVKPDVAVITNVGLVHLERFGTPDRIVAGKWELVEALDDNGTAVLPAGDERLRRPHRGATITFGDEAGADVRVTGMSLGKRLNASFRLETPIGAVDVTLAVAGSRQPLNAAAAAAAAISLGLSIDEIAAGLESAQGGDWRMEVHSGVFTVVNDTYNANPDSMKAALHDVAKAEGRKLAVLGLMAELGHVSKDEHLRIGRLARELGFHRLIVIGEDPGLAAGAGDIAISVDDAASGLEAAAAILAEGDIILVKASRVAGLEELAQRLVREATQ